MMRARTALSIDVKTWLKGLWLNVGLAFGADTKAAVVATIVSVLMGFTPIVVAIITRHFIDAFGPRPTVSPPEIVVVYALAYGTLQLGRVSLLAQRGRLTERIVASVTARLMRLPPRWIGIAPFENAAMYNDIQTVDRLIGMRSMGLVTTFGQGIAAVVSSGGVLILLARLDWRIAAAFVVVVLPSAVWQAREKMRATAIVQELAPDYRRLDYLLELATQPNTATDIRLRNGESFLEETYQSHAHRVLGQLRGLRAREGLRSLAVTVFGGLTLGGMAWWAALWALGGHWSSGELGMFFVAISEGQRALAQLYMFAASFADIARAIVTLSTVVHIPGLPDGRIALDKIDEVGVVNASLRYPGRPDVAVDDATICVQRGQLMVIVGENGAGKSSLAKLLCRLYDPTQGCVQLNNQDLRTLQTASWRRLTAAAFQDVGHFPLTLENNITLGRSISAASVTEAINAVGLGSAVAHLPAGLQQMMGREWGGSELSGGEWQRIGTARAFVSVTSDLVILDEPNAFLDAHAEMTLFHNLVRFIRSEERCGILITHRLGPARVGDHIIVMQDGRIVEAGTHEQLLAADGRYAYLWSLQAQQYTTEPEHEHMTAGGGSDGQRSHPSQC